MVRRRLIAAFIAVLGITILFLTMPSITIDKKDTISKFSSILEHKGQTSRHYADHTRSKWGIIGPNWTPTCRPESNVVFIKTHKTASSTTSGILDHYAYRNNLTVAVPPDGLPYMHRTQLFDRGMIAKTHEWGVDWKKGDGFNMLTSHARYNRPEMDAVVHNARYITIIRDPRDQFISSFVYFHFVDHFTRLFESRGEKYVNPVEGFLQNPSKNYEVMQNKIYTHALWNQQIFDLGLDTNFFNDVDVVDETIKRLDTELALVMITEYYDESLLLLRDTLCWDMGDILYTQRLVRNSSISISVSEETRQKIREWNAADTRLYDHFNRTLWRRISAYGPTFQEELQHFREQLASTPSKQTGKHTRDTKKIVRRMKDRGILII